MTNRFREMKLLGCSMAMTLATAAGRVRAEEATAPVAPEYDEPAPAGDALEKDLQNPVAKLISIPVQYTADFNVGPLDRMRSQLNLQPVVPFSLTRDVNLILRAILPILSSPDPTDSDGRLNGLGDLTLTAYFARAKKSGLILGVGPAVLLPTATDDGLGTGKWGAGPSVVVMGQPGAWSVGALVTQIWSFAGSSDRADVSQLQVQPIASYRLGGGWSLGYAGIIIANWDAESDQRWTLPLGLTLSYLLKKPGWVPLNFIGGGGVYAVRPDDAADWFLRAQINVVLPG